MTKPFPCCGCGCAVCTALFAENWAMRACLTGLSGVLPPADQADNDAYVAALNAAWNSVSISWADDSFTALTFSGSVAFTCKIAEASVATLYSIHGRDGVGTVHDYDVSDSRLTVAAVWETAWTGASESKPCRPAWAWSVSGLVDGSRYYLIDSLTGSPPRTFGAPASLTGGGFVVPVAWSPTTSNCSNPPSAFEERIGAAIEISGAVVVESPFSASLSSRLKIAHNTGPVALPSC